MNGVYTDLVNRQSCLISKLKEIYPIQVFCAHSIQNNLIRDIILPNSIFEKMDKEQVAVGLGYVCHCVQIISGILFIPLRYPLIPRSSRSFILDLVSLNVDGSKQ